MTVLSTDILRATVWEDNDATEMARFLVNGANGVQSDVDSIVRKIFDLANANALIATDTIVVVNTIFDTLQTTALDPRWTEDSTGYNFRDKVVGSNFPVGGRTYRVEYQFTGTSSPAELFMIVFEHPAQKIHSS